MSSPTDLIIFERTDRVIFAAPSSPWSPTMPKSDRFPPLLSQEELDGKKDSNLASVVAVLFFCIGLFTGAAFAIIFGG